MHNGSQIEELNETNILQKESLTFSTQLATNVNFQYL